MVTADGFVKILDFGLAKLRADGSGGPGAVVRLRSAHLARVALAPDRRRRRPRDGRLHVSRAGARAAGRLPLRPVHAGRDPLRDGDGPPGLPARDGRPRRSPRSSTTRRSRSRRSTRLLPPPAALGDRAVPRQGPRRALRLDPRPRPRGPGAPGAPLGRADHIPRAARGPAVEAVAPARPPDRAPRRGSRGRAVEGGTRRPGAGEHGARPSVPADREAGGRSTLRSAVGDRGGRGAGHRDRPPRDQPARPAGGFPEGPERRAPEQHPPGGRSERGPSASRPERDARRHRQRPARRRPGRS